MKSFLFLSKILAGCAFFSNCHARNNLSFLGSTNLITIKKMVFCKKFPTFVLKFSDGQKKSVGFSEKAIDVVYVEIAPDTFFESCKKCPKLIGAGFAAMLTIAYILQAFEGILNFVFSNSDPCNF